MLIGKAKRRRTLGPRWLTNLNDSGSFRKKPFSTKIATVLVAGMMMPAFSCKTKTDAECTLKTISPAEGGRVIDRSDVSVQASVGCRLSSVWVVVHPTAGEMYWVQDQTSEREGVWITQAYFGRPNQDWGAGFAIKAVGDPKHPLHAGQQLPYWADGAVASDLIEVTKRAEEPRAPGALPRNPYSEENLRDITRLQNQIFGY
jgi:hypothetical protein